MLHHGQVAVARSLMKRCVATLLQDEETFEQKEAIRIKQE
jgi:hypothetical protein